jgi:hypothetical protein
VTASQPWPELPASVRAALQDVDDFSFSFAQPGFYAVLAHLKTGSTPRGPMRSAVEVNDWSTLLERPADFRGLPVTIEGVVGRNKAWRFEQDEYRELGTVWQLELWRRDQPITCTLVLTENADDIPVNATVRVTGYFIMVRQYYSRTNRPRQAALLVADGPTLVAQAAARGRTRGNGDWVIGLLVAATVALLVIWLLLRRSATRSRQTSQTLRASRPAPTSLAYDLAAWAAEESDRASADSTEDGSGGRIGGAAQTEDNNSANRG